MRISRTVLRELAFPLTVAAISLATTAGLSFQMQQAANAQDQERFGVAVDHLHDSIVRRLDAYINVLQAGAGLLSDDLITPDEFRAFASRIDIRDRYPGIQGIGYTERIDAARLDAVVGEQRQWGNAEFSVWPEYPRSEYHPILYLEPQDRRNRAAIGYDMFTNPVRRAAMEHARDTGRATASAPVTLVQEIDEVKQTGFLIYVPVYNGGGVPATDDERGSQLRGFVYSPFRTGDLFTALLGRNPRPRATFELFDGPPSDETLLFRIPAETASSRLAATRVIEVAGRQWTAHAFSTSALDDSSGGRFVPIVNWGGLAVTLLLTALATRESRARQHAERSEASAAEASQRFRQLANSIPQLAWMARPDGWVYWYNDRWYMYTGKTPAEMEGWGWKHVHDPVILPRTLEAWEHSRRTGEPFEMEFPLRGADGRFRLFLGRAVPLRDTAGQIVQWFGTNTDVQYRHDAEAARQEQAETLAIVNRSGMQLAGELDLDRLVQAVTDAATKLTRAQFGAFFGTVADSSSEVDALSVLSGEPHNVFAGFPTPQEAPLFRPTFRGDRVVRSDDITAGSEHGPGATGGVPPGDLPLRSYMAVPVKSRSGEVLGGLFFGHAAPGVFTPQAEQIAEGIAAQAAIAIDNARLYRRVQELLESERIARMQAERVSHLKDEFLATLSHELRTPLNAVMGWAHMLCEGSLNDEQQRHAVDTILRNARAQSQLIEDLLDMSRIVSGRLHLEVSPIDLRDTVEAAINVIRPTAAAKRIDLTTAMESRSFPVLGDPHRLQQVVWNLLTNAVKFTPAGGGVHVRLARAEGCTILGVEDTGSGIDPDFLPYVFDRFRQADGSVTRRHGGLGLGLSIVHSLVEMHAGHVRVTSEGVNRGATFTITLPAVDEEVRGGKDMSRDQRPFPSSSRLLTHVRVLVVDDDPDGRELACEILARHGAQVTVASSGDEALRVFNEAAAPPDLLVSDLGMPDMDGHELLRRIRALPSNRARQTRAIALTAYAGADDRARAIAASYDLHLAKPFAPGELVEAVLDLAGRESL